MDLKFLKTIGLDDKEADMYEILLSLGETPVNRLVKESKLKRATAYKTLYQLEEKGLVSKKTKDKKIHFRPEPPSTLLTYAENKVRAQERARDDLRQIIPELASAYTLAVEKPIISTFEGFEGLKDIYEDTLREGKEIHAVLQTSEVSDELYDWLTKVYVKKRAAAKIPAKVIVASGKWSETYQEKDEKELRTTKMVDSALFPFQHEVNVYGDKVAFMNYKKGEALIGIVIKHPQIALTMKAWFDLAWRGVDNK